jgi:hypothetical protein
VYSHQRFTGRGRVEKYCKRQGDNRHESVALVEDTNALSPFPGALCRPSRPLPLSRPSSSHHNHILCGAAVGLASDGGVERHGPEAKWQKNLLLDTNLCLMPVVRLLPTRRHTSRSSPGVSRGRLGLLVPLLVWPHFSSNTSITAARCGRFGPSTIRTWED